MYDVLHLEHDWTVYFSYSITSILLCLVKLFLFLYCCHLANRVVYIKHTGRDLLCAVLFVRSSLQPKTIFCNFDAPRHLPPEMTTHVG